LQEGGVEVGELGGGARRVIAPPPSERLERAVHRRGHRGDELDVDIVPVGSGRRRQLGRDEVVLARPHGGDGGRGRCVVRRQQGVPQAAPLADELEPGERAGAQAGLIVGPASPTAPATDAARASAARSMQASKTFSFDPTSSYTIGLETPAPAATSSIAVAA
jgi:hypothetical protein